MAKTRGTGLLMAWMDVDPAHEDEFNRWCNTAYIPSYPTVPGYIRTRRYLTVEGQPKYPTVYEFENAGVPDTSEWSRARSGKFLECAHAAARPPGRRFARRVPPPRPGMTRRTP